MLALTHRSPPINTPGVKLSVFDGAKKALAAAEQAYDEECLAMGLPPPVREEWRPRGRNGNGAKAGAGGKPVPARA